MSAPRWTRALLGRLAAPDRVDEVLGDLNEAHRIRVERRGRILAAVLTSLEAIDMAFALRWQRGRVVHRLWRTVPPDLQAARRRYMPPVSWLDFKLGLRMLARHPGLTIVGGAAMALGIAVGAGGLHVLSELIYPDRPYEAAGRIVGIQNVDMRTFALESRRPSIHDFERWRTELRSVEHVGAVAHENLNFAPDGDVPLPVLAARISASAFTLAPTPPVLGRPLLPADESPGAPAVAVLAHWLWQARFDGDPEVVGSVVTLGGEATTVVGVMPQGFELHTPSNDFIYPFGQDVWTPFRFRALDRPVGVGPRIDVFGRLAPGVTLEEAQAELATLDRVAAAEWPETHAHLSSEITTFRSPLGVDRAIGLLGIVTLSGVFVGLVMIMLCANVALMMYARAATREGELVVRSALGASRVRIVAQLFAEAVALAGVATLVGLFAASWGVRWVWRILERIAEIGGARWPAIDLTLTDTSLVVAVGLAFLGAVVAGVLPGLQVTSSRQTVALQRHAGRGTAAPLGRTWSAILVTQVALTTMIVPIAALVGIQMVRTRAMDMGLPAEEYLTVRLEMDGDGMRGGAEEDDTFRARYGAAYGALATQLAREPGVSGVTVAENVPGFWHRRWRVDVEDPPAGAAAQPGALAQIAAVDPAFFEVMGVDLVAGRAFGSVDFEGETRAVIVNESFVERFLGGGNAIARRLRYRTSSTAYGPPDDGAPPEWLEVVGVTRDIAMYGDATSVTDNAGIYEALRPGARYPVRLAIHVPGAAADFVPRLRAAALHVAPQLRLRRPIPLSQANEANELAWNSWFFVLALVGGFAVLLTNAGIYAIISFTVARRTREIGVRVALGADHKGIVAAVLSRMTRRVGIGVGVGGVLGLAFAYVLSEGTLEVTPGMWASGVLYMIGMIGVCMAACILPTRRALAIQPTEALAADG
jgi:predicted permease